MSGAGRLRVCQMLGGDQWAGAEIQAAQLCAGLARSRRLELSAILFSEGRLAAELRRCARVDRGDGR